MSFYIIHSGNDYDGWFSDVEFFKNEYALLNFKKRFKKGRDKISFIKKAESIVEIIAHLCGYNEDDEKIILEWNYLNNRFGKSTVSSVFQDEHFNEEIIKKIKKKIGANFDKDGEDYFSSDDYKEGARYKEIDWYDVGQEEIERLDREDEGDWRIANDFG